MEPSNLISVIAVAVSLITFALSAWHAWRSEVIGMRPILAVIYDDTRGWMLQNVGNGPALNVLVAEKETGGKWRNPVRIPPLAEGSEILLAWLDHTNVHAIGATYADFKERSYTSTCANDLTRTTAGREFGPWPESEIKTHWQKCVV